MICKHVLSFHFVVSFAVQNFLVWCSPTCLFCFFCLCFGVINHFHDSVKELFFLCFLLWHIVKTLIHFELIFMSGILKGVQFHFLHMGIQFSQHHLLKTLSFTHRMFLAPLSKISWLYMRGFISILFYFLFYSIGLCICFYASTILFWLL